MKAHMEKKHILLVERSIRQKSSFCTNTIKDLGYAEVQTWITAVPTKRKYGSYKRKRELDFVLWATLSLEKCLLSNSFVTWHNGKDRSSFVGASVLSTEKV